MAGLFPSIANSQNVDVNGQPLAGAVLTVYNGGTQALASCFQDIGLAIPAQNPMTADETGRLPIFYVNDGVYAVLLRDESGTQIYFYPQVASIGASSSGGGGSGVDPTTIFQTGDPIWLPRAGIRAGWVRMNARTIGSATSGATERANNDCQNLFLELWGDYPDAKCPVLGGRGVSAAADWAANKQITAPDMRGKGPFGLDGMGNARANVIPDSNVRGGDTGDTADAIGGEANHVLTVGELAAHTHGTTESPHSHGFTYTTTTTNPGGGGIVLGIQQSGGSNGVTTQTASTGLTVNSNGSSTAHNTMSPFALGTWYLKL